MAGVAQHDPAVVVSPALPSSFPAARLLTLALAGIAEYLVLALRVDGEVLVARVRAVGHGQRLVGAALAVAAALVALAAPALRAAWKSLGLVTPPLRTRLPHLLAHLTAYAGFALLTLRLFEHAAAPSPRSLLGWIAIWVFLGVATAATLVTIGLPPRTLATLLWRTRNSVLAALALGLLAWLAGLAANLLWLPMSRLSLYLTARLLLLTGADIVVRAPLLHIGTRRFVVEIAPVCSGVEGLGLTLVLLAGFLVWRRRELRFPHALLVLPIGAVAAIGANALRLAGLILVGDAWGADLALGAFHSRAGWILFCALALGITFAAQQLPFFSRVAAPGADEDSDNPTLAWLGPLLFATATALVTGAFSTGWDALYPLRIVAALLVLWRVRPELPPLSISWWAPLAGVAVFALERLLGQPDVPHDLAFARGLTALPSLARPLWLATYGAGAVLLMPFIEEMAFRGFLLRRLVDADFTAVDWRRRSVSAVLLSSIVYGALSGSFIPAALAGLIFAAVQLRRGRFFDAVAAHVTQSALAVAWYFTHAGVRWH